jgi:hypothetical protein
MRRLFLLFSILATALVLNAQNIDRKMVLLEIGTGTWCPYCPGAAMGADDLIENGKNVAVIEYHGGDEYETTNGGNRLNWYGVTAYPTSIFDGLLKYEGGSASNSLYTAFLPKYNQRIETKTHIDLDLNGEVAGLGYTIKANVTRDENLNDHSNNIFVVVTESEIEQAWQGQSHLNFVQRLMVNGSQGTPIDWANGEEQELEFSFTRDMAWNIMHTEVIVFVQDMDTKEVLQAQKMPLSSILPENENDLSVMAANNVPENNSIGYLEPRFEMINLGNANATSAEITYNVNGENETIVNWSGDLEPFHTESFFLDPIHFTLLENNILTIEITKVNGGDDENPETNTITVEFGNVVETFEGPLSLLLRTNDTPEQNHWALLDAEGNIIQEGGPYEVANQMYNETIEFPENRSVAGFSFVMYDEGGNGLVKDPQYLGFFSLTDNAGAAVCPMVKSFGYAKTIPLYIPWDYTGINDAETAEFEIYPNPVQANLNIKFNMDEAAQLSIFNIVGQTVYQQEIGANAQIDMSSFESGVYFINLKAESKSVTRRIVVE